MFKQILNNFEDNRHDIRYSQSKFQLPEYQAPLRPMLCLYFRGKGI